MTTNPNNSVGTNAAFGGRTSVNAFNDGLAGYTRGILSGWACSPDSGLTVALGGDGNTRDVAIAEDNAGNKTTINNISGSPVSVTIGAAPASNSRIDAIVAYVDNPATGSATVTDNPSACGLIAVSGTPAASPVAPNESAIRQAITADGASGANAYYAILAYITIANGTTDITTNMITSVPATSTVTPQQHQKSFSTVVTAKAVMNVTEWTSTVITDNFTFSGLEVGAKYLVFATAHIYRVNYRETDYVARINAVSGVDNLQFAQVGVGGFFYKATFMCMGEFTATSNSAVFNLAASVGATDQYGFGGGLAYCIKME